MTEHWCWLDQTGDTVAVPLTARAVCRCGWKSGVARTPEAVLAGFDHTATAYRMAISARLRDTAVSVSPVTGSARSGSPG